MKNGFTLIELLAVIVILSIIALIAVPIVLNIIGDSKEKAFEQSINGIVKSANIKSTMELKTEEILYKYENNKWGDNKLNIDGQTPKYVEIKVNKKGQTRYAITDGKYCATKEYDSKINIKKIGNENNDKKIEEQYCKLDMKIPTKESCFEFDKSTGTIKNYKCGTSIPNVVIPSEIGGVKVTSIYREAFKNKLLTSVVIPDTVTSIGGWAFEDNNLTKIAIPDSVTTIASAAFTDNDLPEEQAFIYNRNSDGSVNYSSLNSYGGKKRENVIIPEEVNGVKLTTIGSYSFERIYLKSVTIPSSVKVIGNGAFAHNRLKSVTIPDSVTTINISAFTHNYEIENLIIGNSVTSIGGSAFSYNNLTNLVIPDNVTTIGNNAFCENRLTNIVIPKSVTYIGQAAFTDNKLPEGQAYIYNRKSDGSIDYSSLNSYGGEKRKDVIIPSGIVSIGSQAFYDVSLINITIPDSVNTIKQQAFQNNYLTSIIIPDSVINIEDFSFCNNNLSNVIIKGKKTTSDFTSYPSSSPFGWASGYSDSNITWE